MLFPPEPAPFYPRELPGASAGAYHRPRSMLPEVVPFALPWTETVRYLMKRFASLFLAAAALLALSLPARACGGYNKAVAVQTAVVAPAVVAVPTVAVAAPVVTAVAAPAVAVAVTPTVAVQTVAAVAAVPVVNTFAVATPFVAVNAFHGHGVAVNVGHGVNVNVARRGVVKTKVKVRRR